MLTASKRSKTSWALLQTILVALETPRSHRGLQALARHRNALTSAVVAFLDCTMPPHRGQASGVTKIGQTAPVSVTPLQAALNSFHRYQAESSVPGASDSTAGQTDTLSQQQQQQLAVAKAASISTAHRCLESMLAREAVFTLPAAAIAQALHSPAVVFTAALTCGTMSSGNCRPYTAPGTCSTATPALGSTFLQQQQSLKDTNSTTEETHTLLPQQLRSSVNPLPHNRQTVIRGSLVGTDMAWDIGQGAGVYVGCCSLLLAGLRHHAKAVRRCMALVAASTRALLQMLMHWNSPHPR